jgi:hypothetical protein
METTASGGGQLIGRVEPPAHVAMQQRLVATASTDDNEEQSLVLSVRVIS